MPAYGIADAEARVEKEIREVLPDSRVTILEVTRPEAAGRIVEDFLVSYRVAIRLTTVGEDRETAKRAALRQVREAVQGTRYARIPWDLARPNG